MKSLLIHALIVLVPTMVRVSKVLECSLVAAFLAILDRDVKQSSMHVTLTPVTMVPLAIVFLVAMPVLVRLDLLAVTALSELIIVLTSLVQMVVLVTTVWLEHLVTACQDSPGNTVRSILTNVCQVHAIMEVAAWTGTIVFIVCVLQEQEEAIVNRVCNRVTIYLHDQLLFLYPSDMSRNMGSILRQLKSI